MMLPPQRKYNFPSEKQKAAIFVVVCLLVSVFKFLKSNLVEINIKIALHR